MDDPFKPWIDWFEWLISHDGRLHRRQSGGNETDSDMIGTIPSRIGKAILTVGDLRRMVEEIKRLRE